MLYKCFCSVLFRVGVKAFEDLDLKDLILFIKDLKGFEILLPKKDFGIDLNPFVSGQNPSAFLKNPLNFNSVMCVYF